MLKDVILENNRRREIFNFLKANPGLHLRELQRRLKLPLTSLEHHLDYMVRKKVIYREKDGRFTRFYAMLLDEEDKKVISALRQKRLREIVLIILGKEGAKFQELQEILGLPSSTLFHYLKYLANHDIITRDQNGAETIYNVKNDRAAKALIVYKPSFLDNLVDKALYTFMETHFRKPKK
jgi:predicted transcriptional regulator